MDGDEGDDASRQRAYVAALEAWLRAEFPECVLMPTASNFCDAASARPGKNPAGQHAGRSAAHLWADWTDRFRRQCSCGLLILLRAGLLVLDVDDAALADDLERRFPELAATAAQATSKGRHFFLRRTPMCDTLRVWDGARQLSDPDAAASSSSPGGAAASLPIDIKTVCSTGTGGVISVAPSPGKRWVRLPYLHAPLPVSDRLLLWIVAGKQAAGAPTKRALPPASAGRTTTTEPASPRTAVESVEREGAGGLTPARMQALLDCLSDATAADRGTWLRVGMALRREGAVGGDADRYWPQWLAFSRRGGAKFESEEDCRRTWGSLPGAECAVSLGTVHHFAARDSPDAYGAWLGAAAASPASALQLAAGGGTDEAARREDGDGAAAVRERIAQLLRAVAHGDHRPFADVDANALQLSPDPDGAGVRFQAGGGNGIAGVIHKHLHAVTLDDGTCLGGLGGAFPVEQSMGFVHGHVPAEAQRFVCSVLSQSHAVLHTDHPVSARLAVYNAHQPGRGGLVKVQVQGQRDASVTSAKKVGQKVSRIMARAQEVHLRRALGSGGGATGGALNLFAGVANVFANITVQQQRSSAVAAAPPDDDDARRTDRELVQLLLARCADLRTRFATVADATATRVFHCDRDTNVWCAQNRGQVEELVDGLFEQRAADLTAAERQYIQSGRGRSTAAHILTYKLPVDAGFPATLDSNLDVLALAGGMALDSSGPGRPVLRPLRPEDRAQTTTGWAYDAAAAQDKRAEVEAFLARVLPVAEERRLALAFFASMLSGKRAIKRFLVLTDRREGNNGKSSLVALLNAVFGNYAVQDTQFFCRAQVEGGRNQHGGGLERLGGKRLVTAEELKNHMTLDDAMLKRFTGGLNVVASGRCMGVADRFAYTWQAGLMLVFNQGDCPRFDTGDGAFMERMLVVPMRARFAHPADLPTDVDGAEPYTFPVDPVINHKFAGWRSAMLDVLADHYTPGSDLFSTSTLPPSMREWRTDVTAGMCHVAEWIERAVAVTGVREDHVTLSQLYAAYDADFQVRGRKVAQRAFGRIAKAFLTSRAGVSFKAVGEKVKDPDGRWVSVASLFRGVRMQQQLQVQLTDDLDGDAIGPA